MAKLLLQRPDGSTREYVLERERVTIGRRADNDICLPYPAVSGEHAVIVTILDDSFLEDLRSTNGTIVNGKAITKHFLRDNDQIDIGRQMLVYTSGEFTMPARESTAPPTQAVAVTANGGATIGDDEATVKTRVRAADGSAPSTPSHEGGSAAPSPVPSHEPETHAQPSARPVEDVVAHNDARLDDPSHDVPAFEVLEGPSTGLVARMALDDFVLGRVGTQIAVVRRTSEGFRLMQVEGETLPRVNGSPISETGALLREGDVIEVADTRVAFRPAS